MRVIIAGSRDIPPDKARELVWKAIKESEWELAITEIIHGGARGIDTAAAQICEDLWPVTAYPADWDKHGKAAGPIRNRQMAENAEALIAIWDGSSRGTANMIKTAKELGLQVFVYKVEE